MKKFSRVLPENQEMENELLEKGIMPGNGGDDDSKNGTPNNMNPQESNS